MKRTMIASLLIEQSTEMKGKRPTELDFEDLVDVVHAVVKNRSMPDVSDQSEQFCECDGIQDLIAGTGQCRKCGKECTY
jgi:hypothetical protein